MSSSLGLEPCGLWLYLVISLFFFFGGLVPGGLEDLGVLT